MKKKTLLAVVALASLLPAACEMDVWTQGQEFDGPDELCLNVHSQDPCPSTNPDGLTE